MPKPTVLLVDYDPKRIEATTRPFEHAGYTVEVARDGIAGVEAFGRVRPDVVFVEMMLPKRHGFDVCQELRRMRPDRKTPVFILGSTHAERYRLQALGAGANDYLARPVPDEKLLELCRNVLAEPNQDLPARSPAAREAAPDAASTEELDDLLSTLDDAPEPPTPERAFKSEMKSNVAPPIELGDLTDDEITARLDEILPSAPGSSRVAPSVAPQEEPEEVSAEPEATMVAESIEEIEPAEPEASVEAEPSEPEGPPAAEMEPEPIEVSPPAPEDEIETKAVETRVPPEARSAQVPTARATLPQSASPREWKIPAAAPSGPSPSLRIAAAIGAVALAVVGLFAWRAMTGEDETAAAGSVVSQDFARVAPSPTQETSSPERSDPASQGGATDTVAASTPVPVPAPVDPPASRSAEPTREPRAEPARTSAPSPSEPAPQPAQKTPSPAVQPERPADGRPAPSRSPDSEPSPAVASVPPPSPVEEPLGLPSSIASVAPASLVVEKAAPAPAPARTLRGALVELSDVDAAPVAISRSAPTYPAIALRMRREGKVTVRLLVDETGRVADAQMADGSAEFRSEALKAAREWTYQPATKEGVPVKVWVTEVIGFKL